MGELCGAGVVTRARRASSSPSARGKPRRERNDERKPRSYGHPGREMMASPETWEPIRCVERFVQEARADRRNAAAQECGGRRVPTEGELMASLETWEPTRMPRHRGQPAIAGKEAVQTQHREKSEGGRGGERKKERESERFLRA